MRLKATVGPAKQSKIRGPAADITDDDGVGATPAAACEPGPGRGYRLVEQADVAETAEFRGLADAFPLLLRKNDRNRQRAGLDALAVKDLLPAAAPDVREQVGGQFDARGRVAAGAAALAALLVNLAGSCEGTLVS